jgi:dihydrodipicolinate synthase/N-acetylneuraminate lyase
MSVPQASANPEGSKARVTGLVPPIATPFRDGTLDLDSLHRLLDDLSDHVSGVLVGGSVGEAASLTIEERVTVMREVDRGIDRDRQHLAVSISDNSIEYSRELAYAAGEVNADLVMVSCPNYFTNDSAMLEAYFGAVADFAPCDICLYDNPIASHTTLSIQEIVQLTVVAAPKLTHVKVTDTSVDKVAALRDATDLQILAGDDAVLWHQLTRGAKGGMVALPMIYPDRASRIWTAFSGGDLESAFDEYRHVTTFIHCGLGAPDYVPVIKSVLHARGVIASAETRLPNVALTARRLNEVLGAL